MEDKKKNLIYETPSIDVMEFKYITPSDPDPFDF